MRFSSAIFRNIARTQVGLGHPSDLSTVELIALHAPVGELWDDLRLGVIAKWVSRSPNRAFRRYRGDLSFRRVDCDAWLQSVARASEYLPKEARLEALDLSSITADTAVPLNTVLRELPDDRKSDLIAVCTTEDSEYPHDATVLRMKAEMGPCLDTWGDDAAVLSASWEDGAAGKSKKRAGSSPSVLESLQRAGNLKNIKTWVIDPVWLSTEDPPNNS